MNGPQGVQTTELIKRERCVREPHSQLNRRPQNHKKYLIFKYEDPRLGELEHFRNADLPACSDAGYSDNPRTVTFLASSMLKVSGYCGIRAEKYSLQHLLKQDPGRVRKILFLHKSHIAT